MDTVDVCKIEMGSPLQEVGTHTYKITRRNSINHNYDNRAIDIH